MGGQVFDDNVQRDAVESAAPGKQGFVDPSLTAGLEAMAADRRSEVTFDAPGKQGFATPERQSIDAGAPGKFGFDVAVPKDVVVDQAPPAQDQRAPITFDSPGKQSLGNGASRESVEFDSPGKQGFVDPGLTAALETMAADRREQVTFDSPGKQGFGAPERQSIDVSSPGKQGFDTAVPKDVVLDQAAPTVEQRAPITFESPGKQSLGSEPARESVGAAAPGKQDFAFPALVVDNGREPVAVDSPGKAGFAAPTLAVDNGREPVAVGAPGKQGFDVAVPKDVVLDTKPPALASAAVDSPAYKPRFDAATYAAAAAHASGTATAAPASHAAEPIKHDVKTTKVLQEALVRMGEDIGKTGKNHDGVDGDWKGKTQKAFEKVCAEAGVDPKKVDLSKPGNEDANKLIAHMGSKILEREQAVAKAATHEQPVAKAAAQDKPQARANENYGHEGNSHAALGELCTPKVPNCKAGGQGRGV